MQKLTLIIAFLLSGMMAGAACGPGSISAWPNSSVVKSNPIFMLSFYAVSQKVVAGLNKQYAVYLRSGRQRVTLQVSEVCVAQFRLTQVILKPVQQLTAGKEYELVIDSMPGYNRIYKWNTDSLKTGLAKWKVLKDADTGLPEWISMPKYESKSIVHYGCGPSVSVLFGFTAADKSDILIKTTVQNTRTGKLFTYYLEPTDKTKINVGHSMCSGAFKFDTDDTYEASFALLDASGNTGCLASAPVRFTRPVSPNRWE